jgi:glycerol-3-phosphate dehydrogenase
MNRMEMIKNLDQKWDIIIIGGGATGLGAAIDSASRGLKTLLLEQHDFAKASSSRSTKLIHGGLRYLQQGHIPLVLEALRERGRLCRNAPHLIYHRAFFVPSYHWWEGPFYGIGVKIYDMLAGKLGLEPSKHLNREETLSILPTIEQKDLRGGTIYYDGQFDDARLAITLALTAAHHGASVINYMKVIELIKENNHISGVKVEDRESGQIHTIKGKVIINATGIFSDEVRHLDDPKTHKIVQPSQGIHLVLDQSFLESETAILIPHTADGRVLFMVPWHDRVLVGTTDTAVDTPSLEPVPREEEIDFVLKEAGKYLTRHPTREDILSVFAGLRPLISETGSKETSAISRSHSILVSHSGLITIAGGKWTTFRKMAEDVIDKALIVGGFEEIPCKTVDLKLHGYLEGADPLDPWSTYGTDGAKIKGLIKEDPSLDQFLHPKLPYLKGEIIWAVRHEMARSVEDCLSRRTRSLLLDAKVAVEIAPIVASLMARELGKDKAWEEAQVASFTSLSQNYIV